MKAFELNWECKIIGIIVRDSEPTDKVVDSLVAWLSPLSYAMVEFDYINGKTWMLR